jgi:hypothetical protein
MVEAVYLSEVMTDIAAAGQVELHMPNINFLVDGWASGLASAAAQLEAHQRASGFDPVLTAAEMRQLCLMMQRYASRLLALSPEGAQQALALRRTALAASRQLCELRPSSAAYLLKVAKDTAELGANKTSRQELQAFQAALQAATAEKGEAGRGQLVALMVRLRLPPLLFCHWYYYCKCGTDHRSDASLCPDCSALCCV